MQAGTLSFVPEGGVPTRGQSGSVASAQQGLRSRAFKFGVYPPQDEFVYEFDQEYLRARGPAPADDTGAS